MFLGFNKELFLSAYGELSVSFLESKSLFEFSSKPVKLLTGMVHAISFFLLLDAVISTYRYL